MTGSTKTKSLIAVALSVGLSVALSATPAMAKKTDEKRNLPSFDKIAANGSSDVSVQVGPRQSVVVKAEDGEHKEIMTEVKDGQLKIWRENKDRSWRNHSATVIITVPKLNKLASRGSGDATVTGVKADHFDLVQQGSGDVDMEGSCKTAKVISQGSGDLESEKFSCDEVSFTLQGSGDMTIRSFKTKMVDFTAQGSGDIDFEGTCNTFDLRHMASGDVDAHKFKCKVVHVKAQGSGDMRVFATDDATIKIRGSGDVELYGGARPSSINASGSGRVRTRD